MAEPLLRVEDLSLHYRTEAGTLRALDGVSFEVRRGEAVVLLGESGCGKSSLAKALMRLLPRNVASYTGRILLGGSDVMALPDGRFRREVQWARISIVMQAAMNALNPVMRVGEQVAEPLRVHARVGQAEAMVRAAEALAQVGVAADFMQRYPFELSGGMRQRVVLAMALITRPDLVVLDEPTSALDVLTQAGIMNLLKQIKRDTGTSFILITHDVGTSSELADRVALMYAGQIVEDSPAGDFFERPAHPYARALMASVPRLRGGSEPAHVPGEPPDMRALPHGCRFAARCAQRFGRCDSAPPVLQAGPERAVRCWLFEQTEAVHDQSD